MKTTVVGGRFVHPDGSPVEGWVKFVPSKIWLDDEDGRCYPTFAPEEKLHDGCFVVNLTRTDTYIYPWFYTVTTPLGTFTIWVEGEGPLNLKDLLPNTAT